MLHTPTKPTYDDSIDDTALFHTPLQRLREKPINDRNFQLDSPQLQQEKTESDELIPLAQIPLRLSQTKLLYNAKTENLFNCSGAKKLIYYKAPSSSVDDQFGVREFLPPLIEKKKYPIIYQEPEKEVEVEGETKVSDASPTGQWTNPVMLAALRRQVNKEYEVKRILKLILAVGAVKLASDIAQTRFSTQKAEYVVLAVIAANILSCMYRLLKAQDQCKDLALSNRQRELIGLRPLDDNVLKTAVKPKYSKFTKKTNVPATVSNVSEKAIELSYRRPAASQFQQKVFKRNESNDRIFHRNLNLKLTVE